MIGVMESGARNEENKTVLKQRSAALNKVVYYKVWLDRMNVNVNMNIKYLR